MKCTEPLFMEFLAEVSDIPIDATNFATDAIYKLCAISSRAQLNSEPTAQENWKRTKIWFRLWRTGYGKNKPAFKMGNDAFRRGADLEENPFDEHAKVDIYPGKFQMWKQGWLTEKGMG
ncbi:MAG: hypothetical protein COA96_10180 [SAR86 cluster bacterium]|uniref:Uncharacterized protein n=1 Tax=SAR86 cluster bacterium TaxID=2030880 RepID=A0A2A5AXT8_9GAMM|nr:MAG: hypothetical protein COA96_10180 [SAR86 cluster bacterium]